MIGATSGIAQAAAATFAEEHAEFFLVARNAAKLAAVAADLTARGASRVDELVADLGDLARHPAIVASAGDNVVARTAAPRTITPASASAPGHVGEGKYSRLRTRPRRRGFGIRRSTMKSRIAGLAMRSPERYALLGRYAER